MKKIQLMNSELFKVEKKKNGGEEWGKHGNQFQKFIQKGWGRGEEICSSCLSYVG